MNDQRSTPMKMRDAEGGAYMKRGRFFMRITVAPQERRSKVLPWCASLDDAFVRARETQTLVSRLRMVNASFDDVMNLVKSAATADAAKMITLAKVVDVLAAGKAIPIAPKSAVRTFRKVAEQWTEGEMHALFPDHVGAKTTAEDDRGRLKKWIYPVVENVPIADFTRVHAQEVMRSIPITASRSTRRHVAQLMVRVLNLAVYPCEYIAVSPLPRGFLPKVGKRIAFGHLYPADDAALLACGSIPLPQRLFYGFLAREGMRCDEALQLTWADVDLDRGTVRLDENKTDDPRTWALGLDVVRALDAWKKLRADACETDCVFVGLVKPYRLAQTFREHLEEAKVTRPELFERNDSRRPIRVHDLRATFVTLALAAGQSETWVCDRTGHRSSAMLARYRRTARNVEELGLGWLAPLDEALGFALPAAANAATDAAADSHEEDAVSTSNLASSTQFQRKDSNLRKRNQNPLSCH